MQVDKGRFETFLNYLDAISHLNQDLDMKNNVIAQAANGKVAIVESNLNDLFPEPLSMRFVMLKQKLPLLGLFTKSPEFVNIDIDNNVVKFSDEFSEISITQALPEYVNNLYISPEDLKGKLSLDLELDRILSTELSKIILERISVISTNFDVMVIGFLIKDNKINISLSSNDKVNKSLVLKDLPCIKPVTNQGEEIQINFSVYPFQTKFDNDVSLDLCYKGEGRGNSIIKMKTVLKGIETTFYVKGTVIK